jgi:mRNA-degrading endonuclease RelE of RelBE toxin-antitoxin system
VRYKFLNSFERSLQNLSLEGKKQIKKSIYQLIDAFQSQTIPPGLGLKKISPSLWELRVGLKLRVVFVLEEGLVKWSFVGNHDEVRKLIRSNK